MLPFPLYLALTYLKPKKCFVMIIPIITIVGVTLGVAILMIVLAVMTGFSDTWREKILSFKPHVTIYSGVYGQFIEYPDPICDALMEVPGVTAVCPTITTPVMVKYMDTDEPLTATFIGIDDSRGSVLAGVKTNIAAGRYDVSENHVITGIDFARRLRMHGPGVDLLCYSPMNLNMSDTLYLPEDLHVAGVYDMGMRDFDYGIIVGSLGMARDIVGADRGAFTIQVQVEDPERALTYLGGIEQTLREKFPGLPFIVQTWEQEDSVFFNALRMEKTMMFILLAFIAIVAAFCVTSTLIVITIQKTKEIGLLKALGFSPRRLMTAFVLNGLIYCLLGIGLGTLAGYVVLRNLNRIIALLGACGVPVFDKSIYGLAELPWRIVPGDVISIVSTVFVFCLFASFFPAWRAASMDPVKAINQE